MAVQIRYPPPKPGAILCNIFFIPKPLVLELKKKARKNVGKSIDFGLRNPPQIHPKSDQNQNSKTNSFFGGFPTNKNDMVKSRNLEKLLIVLRKIIIFKDFDETTCLL